MIGLQWAISAVTTTTEGRIMLAGLVLMLVWTIVEEFSGGDYHE